MCVSRGRHALLLLACSAESNTGSKGDGGVWTDSSLEIRGRRREERKDRHLPVRRTDTSSRPGGDSKTEQLDILERCYCTHRDDLTWSQSTGVSRENFTIVQWKEIQINSKDARPVSFIFLSLYSFFPRLICQLASRPRGWVGPHATLADSGV